MDVADGFWFWIGKQLAEIAVPLIILALIMAGYFVWGLTMIAKAKLKALFLKDQPHD